MNQSPHDQFMQAAIEEALKGRDTAAPNPIVGAVIVEDGQIVARGYHVRPGEAHAEVNALKELDREPKADAVLYVTLEPCSTLGRTGKCTAAIIKAGIRHVCVGAIDPNPDHNGRGIKVLTEAGIKVETGILEQECVALNPEFNARMRDEAS